MKKEIYHFPVLFLGISLGISLLGILFGSIFDFSLSSSIVNTSSLMGSIVESFGLSIVFFIVNVGGIFLFKGLKQFKKKNYTIIGYILLVVCFLVSVYYSAHYLQKSDNNVTLSFDTWIAYLFAFLLMGSFFAFFFYFIKEGDKKTMILIGSLLILSIVLQTLFINGMKYLNCRPRYRYLINDELNVSKESFRSWWEFKPFTAKNDYHKSWPSGHTATVSVLLLLPLISDFLRYPIKKGKVVLFSLSLAYVLFVAFYRIKCGAHFLSDVSFGLFFVTIILSILLLLAQFVDKKIPSKEAQPRESI